MAFTLLYHCEKCGGKHGYDPSREVAEACPAKTGGPSRVPPPSALKEKPGSALERAVLSILVTDLGYVQDKDFIRQYCWGLDDGRDYRGDFVFPAKRAIVEAKGMAHTVKRQAAADYERDTLAAALGYRMAHVCNKMMEKPGLPALLRRVIEWRAS